MTQVLYKTKNLPNNYKNYKYLASCGKVTIEELLKNLVKHNKFNIEDLVEVTDLEEIEEYTKQISQKVEKDDNYIEVRYR